ncbi:MAG: hypothetical protein FWD70_02870 [Desulfuromonadales bacterium]|nr:hypothetical protein [Desulfuromonadales bacterium]
MNKTFKGFIYLTASLAIAGFFTACGNSGPTSPPANLSIYYAHNLVFNNSTTLATGYNGSGQLGTNGTDNVLNNRDTLGAVLDSKGHPVLGFAGTAIGGVHSIAFYNHSTVRTWGDNRYGQLGIGINSGTSGWSTYPIQVITLSPGSTASKPTAGPPLSGIIAVAAGAYHNLALRSDNTIWAWGGSNSYGELGTPTTTSSPATAGTNYVLYPVQVGYTGTATFTGIAAGGYHSLALDNGGNVLAWGYNSRGQLGQDTSGQYAIISNVNPMPVTNYISVDTVTGTETVVTPSPVITVISAGGSSSYALASDSTVWAWGDDFFGELGNNNLDDCTQDYSNLCTNNNIPYVRPTPMQVLKSDGNGGFVPLTGIVAISAGLSHVLALDNTGHVWAWGYNLYGQIGVNKQYGGATDVQANNVAYAVEVLDTTGTSGKYLGDTSKIVYIRGFGYSSVAQDSSGHWYFWGDNSYGQGGLGDGAQKYILFPQKMLGT